MTDLSLSDLGWSDHFARQLEQGDAPARIAEIHRTILVALTPNGPVKIGAPSGAGSFAVGDWVGMRDGQARMRLAPRSQIARKAAGHTVSRQLVAANVDSLGIVTSCNDDFNPARLERYVALAMAGDCLPLVIVTNSDETRDRARRWNDTIKRLARLSEISFADAAPEGAMQLLVRGEVVALPLKGVIDLAAERARLEKELGKADADIKRVDAKLSNEKFVANAPEEVIDEQREKREEAESRKTKILEALERLKGAE